MEGQGKPESPFGPLPNLSNLMFSNLQRALVGAFLLFQFPLLADDSIEIVFDKTPIERGLTFDRTNTRPTTVKFGDQESQTWMTDNTIEPSMGWTRSFRFKITDPKFQKAARPSVDVEITYHMPTGNGWSLSADTKTGGRRVGGGGSGTQGWRTDTIRVDDAFFGARDPKSGAKMSVDGFDLRLDAMNTPIYLKSVKIVGFDPKTNVDWKRMTKISALESDQRGGILVFNRAPKHEIRAVVQNMASVARPLFYRFDVAGYDDKNRHSESGQITLKPDSNTPIPLAFNSSNWPLGPYDATLSLFLNKNDTTPLHSQTMRLGIISNARLAKAREGEFLFGLDAANTYIFDTQNEAAFAFYRLMGVDMLRDAHRIDEEINAKNVGTSLERLAREEMRAMLMFDPPKSGDAAERTRNLPENLARLDEITRAHAGRGLGQLRYFEMGNEPDLGFYPGSIPEYKAAFEAMYDTVKKAAAAKGLKPDDTVVMNGGLSFAGPTGERRSREFLQIVDSQKIDAIAYHGHGKGGESERAAFLRARDAAQKGGTTVARFIETESGFSGNDRNGLMEQARTAVEKLTYAQSQGLETFMFFRLFMEGEGSEGGYGLTDNRQEPRPSVLSYRNMVERLRGHHFVKNVNFDKAMDAPGLNAYLFEARDANGKATGRKTLVAWSEAPAQFDLSLRLDARNGKVSYVENIDLFGNTTPTKVIAGNIATVPVGIEPTFVSWQGSGASSLVDVAPSLLTVRAAEPVLVGATTKIPVLARNPESKNQVAEIRVKAFARVPIQATVSPAKLTLRGDGEAVNSQITVALAPSDTPLALPTWWKVFTDVDAAKITPELLNSLPETVAGAQNSGAGQWVSSQQFAGGQRLEIAKIAGGFGEKRAALAVTTIDAPRDMTLPVAASADWYMQWNVNGKEVYNTLERGNEHGGLADHVFDLPLKKGRNIISVQALSGSGGWKLEFGGPKERALALTQGTDPDRLVVSLVAGGQTLSSQTVPLQLSAPIPSVGKVPANASEWIQLQPLAQLGEENVTNFFVKEPDQSRWYKGEDDLSALVWLRESGENLHLFVAAKDDKLVEASSAADLPKADHLRVSLKDESGKTLVDAMSGMVGGKAVVIGNPNVKTVITRQDGRTLYALTMPKTLVGKAPFRLSVSVGDNDSNFLKQKLDLADANGLRLIAR